MQADNKNDYNYLVCFLFVNKDGSSLSLNYFKVSTSSISQNKDFKAGYKEISNVKQIQSVAKSDRKKSLVCLLFTSGDLKCYKFHYEKGTFSDTVEFYDQISTNFNCRNYQYAMKFNYLADGQKITLSCINSIATVQAKFFNSDLNLINTNTYQQFTQCSSIYGHSIIQYNYNYYIISDVKCDNYKRCYEPLEGELSPIEIIYTTQKIEYPVEEQEKEIEEEKLKEEEEKIEEIEIKEENFEELIEEFEKEKELEIEIEKEKIEELNEVFEEMLIETILEEEMTQITENKFNCSYLEKCEECDEESFNKKLCIKCNHEKNYYYLNNFNSEQRDKYINCVNEKTKPQKFYFNEKNLDYEQCYTTCASCQYGGNFEENNCTSCDEIYYIKNPEEENSLNCVLRCQYFYYIKDGIYTCTEGDF